MAATHVRKKALSHTQFSPPVFASKDHMLTHTPVCRPSGVPMWGGAALRAWVSRALGKHYLAVGKPAAAVEALQRAVREEPSPCVLAFTTLQLAVALGMARRNEAALQTILFALRPPPGHATAWPPPPAGSSDVAAFVAIARHNLAVELQRLHRPSAERQSAVAAAAAAAARAPLAIGLLRR